MTAGERHLRITGVLEQVETACEFVVAQARAFGLEERAIHHCYLAVDEACTNIIEHGYADDCGECVIDLFCKASGQAFTIIIVDDSSPFDPLDRPDPDPHTPLSERGSGGWGIFFIKKLMDADEILIAGEALSHCVANTFRDVADEFGSDEYVKKLVLLTDASSNVPGFDKFGEDFVKDMTARGMRVATTVDYVPVA